MKITLFKLKYMAIVICFMLMSCVHIAEPLEAWVVSAENGEPIEGVVVVANWQQKGGVEGGNDIGQLMVLETVTDRKGRFAFPGWGPKILLTGDIKSDRPQLLLFKNGYQPMALSNFVVSDYGHSITLKSDWNGKMIKLKRTPSDVEGSLRDFRHFNDKLEIIIRDYKACDWKKIPNMLQEIHKQHLAFQSKGITGGPIGIHSVDEELINNSEYASKKGGSGCGSPKDLFQTK
jgi:hypothetical protein